MPERFDVVIVGGAVMGSAIAYFLAANGDFDGTILVVERDPTYSVTATTRSWGGVRQQFSTAENIRMSLFGADFVKQAANLLAVGDEAPDLGFREQGYLFLASTAGLPVLENNHRLQHTLGAEVSLLSPAALQDRFPWLNVADLAAGALGLRNEGWIDPHALLQGFRRKARSLGVRYLRDEVVGITMDGGRVTGARLRDSGNIACGVLVNAAGPEAGRLAALAGCTLPVRPRKRLTYVFDCRADLSDAPLTIDVNGVAFRPEGRQYIAIASPPAERDPDSDDLEIDYAPFEDLIWPTLAHRVPAFEAIKLTGAWAGHYDYNTLDQNAIIGPHPEIGGILFCNGFSGHGVQQSPAAGRAVAELIAYGSYRSLDLSAFGYQRILENRPLREANVV